MKLLIVLAAILISAYADNRACPHPERATLLLHEAPVIIENPDVGIRQNVRMDVDPEILRDRVLSCVSVISANPETAPGYLGTGRNREGGISIVMSSKLGRSLEAVVYIYASGEPDPDEPEVDPEPVQQSKHNQIQVSYIPSRS